MTLFTEIELGDWLNKPVTVTRGAMVERVVWGWLSPILGTDDRPDPVPAALFSWAVELAAIAHENPAGLTERDLGPYGEKFSAERRAEILAEVAASGLAAGTAAGTPTGSFPEPLEYPDPAW